MADLKDDSGGILARDAQIGLSAYWKSKKLYYDGSDNLEYFCVHSIQQAETSDNNWYITKYTYSGNNTSNIQSLTGSVDNRATLDWA